MLVLAVAGEMESEETDQQVQQQGEGEDESQDSQVLDELPEGYESVGLASPTNSTHTVKGKYYKQTYRPAWEQMPDFKGWLRGVVGQPTRAYCTYCQKTLHAHRLSLLKHTCTLRHQKAAQIHNSRKTKAQLQAMEHEIHTVVLEEEDGHQVENEEDTIEYAEGSEDDEKELDQEGIEEEEDDDEQAMEMHNQNTFEKRNRDFEINQTKPPVSTYVLDTTKGCAVAGLQVSLYKLIDGRWTYINEGVTSLCGKFSNFVERADFTPGRYKLHYDVDRYFEARKQETMYPFIEVVFDCRSITENYNIPILLSPYGYSTYRGT